MKASKVQMFDKLNQDYSDYISTYDKLYCMENLNEAQIADLFTEMKNVLIEKYHVYHMHLRKEIITLTRFRTKYFKSYVDLLNKFNENYNPRKKDEERYKCIKSFLEHIQEKPILTHIMNDDIEKFISITNTSDFDKDQKINDEMHEFTLLEACCFHGAVQCFKYCISEFKSEITDQCINYSFLSGNTEIIHICHQGRTPNKEWMDYAILSHKFDLITYLSDTFNMEIDPKVCAKYHNLTAFNAFIDQSDDIERKLIYTAKFNLQRLFDFFLSRTKIEIKKDTSSMILFYATKNYNLRMADKAISLGADVNWVNKFNSILSTAAARNAVKICELLIDHGADINADVINKPLFVTSEYNSAQVCSILCKCGANVTEKGWNNGKTPLHVAAFYDSVDVCKILLNHGVDVNIGCPKVCLAQT
ncbi:hypothetical protein TVAG_411790 [Trichomonas vaginalis G3]|uniref:DUF3447 domain-containing protein n=1 Tax=Trichomonas vaginalis (strain ATCC PRA-98 / G3) TaxID=412133 RepID=A2FB87_TRIV3|nr:hypothetical protein TVAG_411790 [Trichomonas vaginalis G3]|eukprot:XP_001310747.1 hypothetical protein [Trichomonas vaginalis G3]